MWAPVEELLSVLRQLNTKKELAVDHIYDY